VSRPNNRWYGNVIRAIRYYPELNLSEQLSPRESEEREAVKTAISDIGRQRDGTDVLKIVEMVDWSKTHTLDGAAMRLHMHVNTAKARRSRFIRAVAKNMRYF